MTKQKKQQEKDLTEKAPTNEPVHCGVVMPISHIEDCSEQHWADVREILYSAIEGAGFVPRIVSDADEVGLIHKRIVRNLYEDPIVVCDVSAKNANVMFELGMRLAFDKPTIIVKDDKTDYSFDTGIIEHLNYPRDLRFSKIVEFQKELSEKITSTLKKSQEDPEYSPFLEHLGTFKTVKIQHEELSEMDFLLDEVKNLRSEIRKLSTYQVNSNFIKEMVEGIEPIIQYHNTYKGGNALNSLVNKDFTTTIKKIDTSFSEKKPS